MFANMIFGNGTDTVNWKPSPDARGTFDILSSCLLTLGLCVWTAVHVNIPRPRGYWTNFQERLVGVFYALASPELIACVAWYQKAKAQDLVQKVNHHLGYANTLQRENHRLARLWSAILPHQKKSANKHHEESGVDNLASHPSLIRKKWTIRHGFYALMGGYAIKTDHIKVPDRFLPEAENRQFFLNLVDLHDWNNNFDEGKKKFANLLVDELPELCEDDIWAKSKADGTAKTLTCIQALWFIAQCITRLTMHTPISLLELNTFGHTVCVLIIYVIWWKKPYNIEIATAVYSHKAYLLLATWYFYSENSPLIQHLAKQGFLCTRERDLVEISDEGFLPDEPTTQPFVLHPGDPIPGTGWTLKEQLSSNGERIYNIELSHQDIKRWQMAWEFGQITQWSFGRFRFHQPATVKGFTEAFTTDPVRERVGLCIETCLEEEIDVRSLSRFSSTGLGLTFVSIVYGGLHALAWFAHFRTSVEALLWRISTIIVMFWLLLVQVTHVIPRVMGYPKVTAAWVILTILGCGIYTLARAYLVVECFINLAHLPSGVYRVPDWAAYFPHLSS